MVSIGTPLSTTATKVLICGSGELGKEVVIELQRYGVEVIAVDRYPDAPAMQVAHRAYTISMLNGDQLREIIEKEKPNYIVPEIEAIATDTLAELESEGYTVVPTARATQLTMNREGIRRLAAEELQLKTSPYRFAANQKEYDKAVSEIGIPFVVKPIMSSSGKGQSTVVKEEQIQAAWDYAQEGGRAGEGKVIIEGFVDFDYEITLLTVRHAGGTSFCAPIGHRQVSGDYQESWQPQTMAEKALCDAQVMAQKITDSLGGFGVFGVELFIRGDEVIFSEVSPRPHDTGLVTLVSQDLSEFALHARAILGLPVQHIEQYGPAASAVIMVSGKSNCVQFNNLEKIFTRPFTQLRLFGKPEVAGLRRMGVVATRASSIEEARNIALEAVEAVQTTL
ncbi:MAG: formate-dependent phosphoribosylglycinamide formyltransferase [Lentisphaeria bacterium]|nr:formate-dependent phosphoribosylglycinamide formyltransferase [Lentisphaeria bacterium]